MHTHTHIHTHARTHACTHTYIHTRTHARTHTPGGLLRRRRESRRRPQRSRSCSGGRSRRQARTGDRGPHLGRPVDSPESEKETNIRAKRHSISKRQSLQNNGIAIKNHHNGFSEAGERQQTRSDKRNQTGALKQRNPDPTSETRQGPQATQPRSDKRDQTGPSSNLAVGERRQAQRLVQQAQGLCNRDRLAVRAIPGLLFVRCGVRDSIPEC